MAWAKDQALGTATPAAAASGNLVTSAAAAAGTWIYAQMSNWTGGAATSFSGGGLTWTLVSSVSNGSLSIAMFRAYAASGLASGTTLTGTLPASGTELKLSAVSFTGGDPDSGVEATGTNTGSATGWSVDPTASSSDALIAGAGALNTNNSSTPDASTTEDVDFQFAGGSCAVQCHRIATASGANPVGGTWGSATAWGAVAGSFSLGPAPLAIQFIGAGAVATGTAATISPAIPTHVAGDMIVVGVGVKPDTASVADEAGWTNPTDGEAAGGGGTTGIDTGPTRVRTYILEATGAGTTVTLDLTGQNVEWAQALVFRKVGQGADTATWSTAAANGIDSTTGSPFTATMGTNPGLEAGDHCAIFGCIPTDVTTPAQFSAHTLTATGMTATVTEVSEPDSTLGNDIGGLVCRAVINTGPATVAPTFTATAGGTTTNVRGPIVTVRLRAVVAATGGQITVDPHRRAMRTLVTR